VLGGYVFGPDVMAALAEGQSLNTDDFPRLEFSAPLRLYGARPEQTLTEILRLGAETDVPLSRAGSLTGRGYESALAGVRFGRPWTVRSERMRVYRRLEGYMGADRAQAARVLLTIDCALGPGEAEVTVGRPGDLLDGQGRALEPSTPADRAIDLGAHRVLLWTKPGGPNAPTWTASWLCPAHERAYLARATGAVPPPERALAALTCQH